MQAIMIDLESIAPVMLIFLIGLLIYFRKQQKRSISYLVCFSVFYVYLLYVVKYTMFPLRLFDAQYTAFMKQAGFNWQNGIQLVPFRGVSLAYLLSQQGLGNILLTLPFGFGLPFLLATTLGGIAYRGFLLTVSIEFVQLLLNLAYGYRVRAVDVDDIIFNFVGTLIGFGLFRLSCWLYHKIIPTGSRVPMVWEHMHAVLAKSQKR